MRAILSRFGEVVSGHNLKELLKRPYILFRPRIDILIVNWVDDVISSRKTGRLSLPRLILFFFYCLLIRLTAKKIVFFRHNICPHHTDQQHCSSAGRALDLFEKLFSCSLTHSPVHVLHGRHYVPHPLFESTLGYHAERIVDRHVESPYYVAFGRVLPYKRLDKLLDQLDVSTRLVILGSVADANHLQYLKEKSRGKNVEFICGIISTDQALSVVYHSHGLILSADGPDMIVSGSMFFALGLGVRVFAISNSFLEWCSCRAVGKALFLGSDHAALAKILAKEFSERYPCEEREELRRIAASEFGHDACYVYWERVIGQVFNDSCRGRQ